VSGFGGVGTAPTTNTNDLFNRKNQKYLSGYDQPLVSQITISYITPRWDKNKIASWVMRDWTVGAFLNYRSGMPLRVPNANSGLNNYLFQGTSFANRVAGQPLFLQDLNCHCFDPKTTFVLNPAAWADPVAGQFSSSTAYYGDYRQQRRPQESASVGRTFRITEKVSFNIRAEFTNIFNRTEVNSPTATNAAAPQLRSASGATASGFGFINTGSTYGLPRQGTIIARIRF